MWKKIIVSLLIALCIANFSNYSYARLDTKYELIKPRKSAYSTMDKVVLINGRAPSGREVTINMYGTTDLTKKSFDLDRLPSEEDYILVLSEKVTAGNMGYFQKQLDLVKGINKLVIDFGVYGEELREAIIYFYDSSMMTGGSINMTRDDRLSKTLLRY